MKKQEINLTTAQFAAIHEVNPRTLHYYDSVGLFSPERKGENQYRYYTSRQSIDFEYIRMLKELNMSIREIRSYVQEPGPDKFMDLADKKINEINREIQKLEKTKEVLKIRKEQLAVCRRVKDVLIEVKELPEERSRVIPFDIKEENLKDLFSYAKECWGIEQCRMGIGSYISVDKVRKKQFERYDGVFSPALKTEKGGEVLIRKKGLCLCGYQRGIWNRLPELYEKMLAFAEQKNLILKGFAFESGMNDFAIADENDYVTRVVIPVEEPLLQGR